MFVFSSPRPSHSLAAYQSFLIPALLFWILGAWLQEQAQTGIGTFPLPVLASLSMLCVALAFTTTRRWVGQGCLWILAFVLGGVYIAQIAPAWDHALHPAALRYHLPQYGAAVSGHILDSGSVQTNDNPGASSHRTVKKLVLQVERVNGQSQEGRIRVARLPVKQGQPLQAGSPLTLTGDILAPHRAAFSGGYDEGSYLQGIGIDATLQRATVADHSAPVSTHSLPMVTLLSVWGWHLLGWTETCRHQVADLFARVLPSPQAQILGGMVLGDRAIPVDQDTRNRFIQTGLIHLLAASGMNVAVVTGGVLWLGKRLRWPRLINIGVAMFALGLYCLLTGLPPSIVRSGSMLALALSLKALDKQLSPLLLFSIAVAAVVLLQPNVLLSLGFQFSCLTTLAIIGLVPALQPVWGHYIGRFWAGLFLIPLVAQLSITPISISTFNTLSLGAIPMNLLALPLTAGLTMLGFVSALCGLFLPWIGIPMSQGLAWLSTLPLNGLLSLVRWGSEIPGGLLHLPSPEPWILAAETVWLVCAALFATGWLLPQWPAIRKLNLLGLGLGVMLPSTLLPIQTHRLQLAWLPVSTRQGAWIVHPLEAQAMVLLAQAPDWKERKTLEDYLSHQAIANAPLWIAPEWQRDWQKNALTDSLYGVSQFAHLGSLQLSWPVGKTQNPEVRLLSHTTCLDLGLGPSVLSLKPLPRFKSCTPDSPWHALTPGIAQKMTLDPKAQRLISYNF